MERGRGLLFFFYSSLSFSMLAFFSCKSQKKNEKQKQEKLFPHNRVRSWLAYLKSLCFQVFLLFLICCDHTRCTVKSIRSQEDKKKKTFPYYFWFVAIAQGARQRAYTARQGKSLRLKQKDIIIILIKYERFFLKK